MAKLPVLNVPELVNTPLQVIADPRVQPPPTPPKTIFMFPSVTLFVLIVLLVVVSKKFIAAPEVVVNTTPVAALVQLPNTLITAVAPDVIVTLPVAGPAIVTSKQTAFVPIVTAYAVALDSVSKITLSAEVGTPALPEPPELAAQLVVVVASQVPAPPTQ
jgi:hypothetical protein